MVAVPVLVPILSLSLLYPKKKCATSLNGGIRVKAEKRTTTAVNFPMLMA